MSALPAAPCRDCGPGYRIGDDGCRHDPYQPDEGETGICRTCAEPIWWEVGSVGNRERTGWSDRNERGGDSVVCFKAVGYRHVPMGSREAAIYRAGFKAGEEAAAPDGQPLVEVVARHQYVPGLHSCSCNREGYLGSLKTERDHADHLASAITSGFEVYIRKTKR